MPIYNVLIKGTSPLLLHKFTPDSELKDLKPIEQAEAVVYRDPKSNNFGFPSDMLYAALLNAGAPKGKFVILPDPGIVVLLRNNGRPFRRFEIDSRLVVIEGKEMIRHRPRFHKWKAAFKLMAEAEEVEGIRNALRIAGEWYGLGDFRPALNGPFGTFEVVRFELEKE